MANQIKTFLDKQLLDNSSIDISPDVVNFESLLEGPKKFSDIIKEYTEDEIARAKQLGYIQGYTDAMTTNLPALSKIETTIKENFANVLLLISLVYNFSKKELQNLKIEQARTKLCSFDANFIDIFFVIDSSIEEEISFSNLLNFVDINFPGNKTLKEKKGHITLFFVNKKDKDIDYSSIKSDYPFSLKPVELLSIAS